MNLSLTKMDNNEKGERSNEISPERSIPMNGSCFIHSRNPPDGLHGKLSFVVQLRTLYIVNSKKYPYHVRSVQSKNLQACPHIIPLIKE